MAKVGTCRMIKQKDHDEKRKVVIEKDGIFVGGEHSIRSIIKNGAVGLYHNKRFAQLNHHRQNAICLGFNSIIDLTDQPWKMDRSELVLLMTNGKCFT
ncbi:unnamed protein product [Absidia cylindrospora]